MPKRGRRYLLCGNRASGSGLRGSGNEEEEEEEEERKSGE